MFYLISSAFIYFHIYLSFQPLTVSCQSGASGQSVISPVGRVIWFGHAWSWWSHSLMETPAMKPSRERSVRSENATGDKLTVMRRSDARSSVKRKGAHRVGLRGHLNIQVCNNTKELFITYEYYYIHMGFSIEVRGIFFFKTFCFLKPT